MRNLLVYHVASGQAFFFGIGLILLAVSLAYGPARRWVAFARTIAACAGACLVAVSATPLPGWFYLGAGMAWAAWIGIEGTKKPLPIARRWPRLAVVALGIAGVVGEWPYHRMPEVPSRRDPTVFVVGDSISAGMGGEAETWPKLLAKEHDVEVIDLSRAGSDVAKAMRDQAGRVDRAGAIVVAEIGGNDVLGATSADAFATGLDALLGRLCDQGRTVILLELPLPPSFNRFGAIQRETAWRHGAILVPKRVLLGVLTTDGATVDTIHLSPAGHQLMAEAIWRVIRPAFGRKAGG